MTPEEAGQHLREMQAAMYEGRSVRNPDEFKRDLEALTIAAQILAPDAEQPVQRPASMDVFEVKP